MVKYKVGMCVMFNWNNPYSKIIRFYNRLKFGEDGFAHCGIITKIEKNRIQIHEAISKGFVKSWYPKWFLDEKIEKAIIALGTTKKLRNVEKIADKYLGKPYGWLDILGIGLSFIFGFRFLKITGAKNLICSEAVSRILYDASNKKINFEEEYGIPFDLITPMHILYSDYLEFK